MGRCSCMRWAAKLVLLRVTQAVFLLPIQLKLRRADSNHRILWRLAGDGKRSRHGHRALPFCAPNGIRTQRSSLTRQSGAGEPALHDSSPTRRIGMNQTEQFLWAADWAWSIPLIVLTVVIHVLGLGLLSQTVVRSLAGRMNRRHPTRTFILVMG